MEWINVPLELFATIVVDLDVESIVRLEQVCKLFQENLKNQNIWKEIALRHVPTFNYSSAAENWRDVALTRFYVRRNMREKKCLSRSIQTKESLGYYDIMTHNCSVAGNEALITLINESSNYSYGTTSFIAYDLVNLTTGERTRMEGMDDLHPNALLTKNYIVMATGYVTHQTTHAQPNLEVLDRKSGERFTITIQNLSPIRSTMIMQQNEDENYDNICVNAGVYFYIVDLKERTSRHMHAMNEELDSFTIPFQFHGKYIAYSSTMRFNGKGKLRLTVLDVEARKQVFFEQNEQLLDYAIADNKVFLGSHTDNGVQWVLKNFDGKILHQYNMNVPESQIYHQGTARIFEHVIVYFKRTQMYFFDIYNGDFLCSLDIVGTHEYGTIPYLRSISPGKFIYSQKHSTRLIDFESRFITKPIKVTILSPDNSTNTLPSDVHEPVPFNELANFTRAIAEVRPTLDLSYYWSIRISQTELKRVSMFYCNDEVTAQDAAHMQQPNAAATKLFTENKIRLYSHVNMNPTDFSDGSLMERPVTRSTCSLQPADVLNDYIRDHVVLYNEIFVNGEWVPVDYEEDKK